MNSISEYRELWARFQKLQDELQRLGRVSESFGRGGFVLDGPSRGGQNRDIDLLILTLVHGNEPGSLLPVTQLLETFLTGQAPACRIAFSVGNHFAAEQGRRYIEKDLNRCFGVGDSVSLEGQRAVEIEKLIMRSCYLLDIHQTNYETKSDFFIFPEGKTNVDFASKLSSETPIITHGLDFSSDGDTSDTFASVRGITAITYEMGQIGRTAEQSERTLSILRNAVAAASGRAGDVQTQPNILKFGQRITSSSQRRLIPNLINMAKVRRGQVLGHCDKTGPILAMHDGYVLFPKYGDYAANSSELCHVVVHAP